MADTPNSPLRQGSSQGTLYFLQVAIGIAALVATLFTAWSDPGLLSTNFGTQLLAAAPTPATPEAGAAAVTPTVRTRPLVGVVIGHWDDETKDPGAVCSDINLTELEVNQQVAARLRDLLVAQNVDVDLLREFDPRLQDYAADALVSIHADSCDYINPEASGYKVAAARARPNPQNSARLVACMRNRYAAATGLREHNSVTYDMSLYHAFNEIDQETTAAIIEVGFLNLDRNLLMQQPDRVAQGIADGLLCFLRNEDPSPETATPVAPEVILTPTP